jgi:hypothetical protein
MTITKPKYQSQAAPPLDTSMATTSRQTLLVLLALVTITLVVYEPTLHNGFVNYDDPDYVTNNYYIL